ncbi:MAG TPA: hypothetical protein VLN49_03850 [Gemmatimonadaceae bacterium]|nr:hypothetical protein [Gemmatimonadaceae bacterium]
MKKPSKRDSAAKRTAIDARRESGQPGGGAGRRDEVGPTGVYPMSGGIPEGHHLEVRTPASWGQGERGAEGYNDAGGSELYMHEGQLLGGLTAGPGGEPTIDIHGGDTAGAEKHAANEQRPKRGRRSSKGGSRKKERDK